jgi:hypothetical protein
VRDTSIQVAYTRTLGKVTAVTPNSVSVVVQKDQYKLSPLRVSQNVTLPVEASTQVISGSVIMTGTTSPITVGAQIISLGIYNRNSNTFQSTWRIRILGPKVTPPPATSTPVPSGTVVATSTSLPSATATPSTTTTVLPTATITPTATSTTTTSIPGARAVGGPIVSAPADDQAPTTFTVQDPHFGLVTVNVPAGVTTLRRFGATTQLDEINIGDNMHITGYFTSASTFTATSIQDYSIQGSTRFVGQISSVNGSTIVATTVADPFSTITGIPVGTVVTLTLSTNTHYLVPAPNNAHGVVVGSINSLAQNQTVTVVGTLDRKSRTFIVVSLVRVHRS